MVDKSTFSAQRVVYDKDLHGGASFEEYSTQVQDEEEADPLLVRMERNFSASKAALNSVPTDPDHDPMAGHRERRIAEREDEYHARRMKVISPDRVDPFAAEGSEGSARSYADVMRERELERQEQDILRKIAQKKKEEAEKRQAATEEKAQATQKPADEDATPRRKRRWDMVAENEGDAAGADAAAAAAPKGRWDETPTHSAGVGETPTKKRNRWDETPTHQGSMETPKKSRSRWDETPTGASISAFAATPVGQMNLMTPTPSHIKVGLFFFYLCPFFSHIN
jgi:splicing factor 3B subunit 1